MIHDPAAILLGAIDPETGILHFYREFYATDKVQAQVNEAYQAMTSDIPKGCLMQPLIDPSANKRSKTTGQSYKQQFGIKYGVYFKDANNDLISGINKVRDLMYAGKVRFARSLKNTIKEGTEYRYPTEEERNKNRNLGDTPLDKNNHCLTGDTLVHTTEGLIPIKELVGKTGQVYCYNEQTGEKVISNFNDVRKTRENAELIKIETDKGIIKCTPDHLILTTDGWVEAGKLTEKSLIISISQENVARVLKITKIDNEDVYNMEVDKYHNFAVNDGLIVHNCMDCLRYICQDIPYDKYGVYKGPDTVDFFQKLDTIKDEVESFAKLTEYLRKQQIQEEHNKNVRKRYAGGYKL